MTIKLNNKKLVFLFALISLSAVSTQAANPRISTATAFENETHPSYFDANRQFVLAGNAVKQANQSQQSAKPKAPISTLPNSNGANGNYGRIPKANPYGKLPKTSDSVQPQDASNQQPAANQYTKLPPQNGVESKNGNYGRIPRGGPYGKLPKTSDSAAPNDVVNQQPSPQQIKKLPTQAQGSAATSNGREPPKLGVRAAPSASTPKVYKTLNNSNIAKQLFSEAIIKPFKAAIAKIKYQHDSGMDPNNENDLKPRPKPNSGKLGDFLGGGANSLVYKDPNNPNLVRKLVRIAGPDEANGSPQVVEIPENINVINDQMAGREILNRFKQTHKNKLLDQLMEVADVQGEPELLTVVTRGGTHKFIQTVEQNISSPVYYKDAKGRSLKVLDENGKTVFANSAIDRIDIRAKNKKRLEALTRGEQPKLKDINVTIDDIKNAITPNEELAINAVIRGLNKHGIVWTDHKMENFDIVSDPKSPLGYKVKFFDFDGFRVVKGDAKKRSADARRLQFLYDNDTPNAPADGQTEKLKQLYDYTASGVGFIQQAATPNANNFRKKYETFNAADEATFNQTLQQYSQGRIKSIQD